MNAGNCLFNIIYNHCFSIINVINTENVIIITNMALSMREFGKYKDD